MVFLRVIPSFKDLECFVNLPGDYPCTKIQMDYQKPSSKAEPFLLKTEKKRDYSIPVTAKSEEPEPEVTNEKSKVPETLKSFEIP